MLVPLPHFLDFNFENILLSIKSKTIIPKNACNIEKIIIKPIPGSVTDIGLTLY